MRTPDDHNNNPIQAWLYPVARNRYATRQHVVVATTVFCNRSILEEVHGRLAHLRFGKNGENRVIVIDHPVGCCSVGFDVEVAEDVLTNTLQHPNVGGIVVVSLGCGSYCSTASTAGFSDGNGRLVKRISTRRPMEIVVQAEGGRAAAVSRICDAVELLIAELEKKERENVALSNIPMAVMNGSSDPTSGLFANPAIGHYCDDHLDRNGRVLFGQTTEILGAEPLILGRISSEHIHNQVRRKFEAATMMRLTVEREGVECEPTQGNIRSGISTLAEKSVGTVAKIGSKTGNQIVEIVQHGSAASTKRGVHFVDTPGQDVLCLTGLVAAGAGLVLFSTGRGAPTGSPIAPTIKITGNRATSERLPDLIDVCLPVEDIFEKGRSLRDIALETLVPFVSDVASGIRLTAAERNGQRDFQVRQLWPIE
jgi:altronate dehydratase large subunit